MKIAAQLLAYALFFALVGFLSVYPELRLLDEDEAIVSLTFSHAGQRIGECKRLSQEELLALPPNMRKPDECPRERHALRIELQMDAELLYDATVAPSGLWADGKSSVYKRILVVAGEHDFTVRMNDSGRPDTVDFEETVSLRLFPGQNLVVYFDPASRRFHFKQVSS